MNIWVEISWIHFFEPPKKEKTVKMFFVFLAKICDISFIDQRFSLQ